jgi:hypothetical protein
LGPDGKIRGAGSSLGHRLTRFPDPIESGYASSRKASNQTNNLKEQQSHESNIEFNFP